MIHDSNTRYGSITRIFHWLMVLLIGWQLLKFTDRIAEGEHWVGQTLVPWHVSIGSMLLLLVALRIIWAIKQRKNRPLHSPATAFLVKAGHGLLYIFMVLMPVSGIMVMLGGGYGVTAFGTQIIAKGEPLAWAKTLGDLHSPIAWILAVLIAGHIGMAFIHHFIHRDDTLKRML